MDLPMYKLDRNAFAASTASEVDTEMRDYKKYSIKERLKVALYLTSIAYRFSTAKPPKMEKTIFTIVKRK